ncbi:unnamed protein product [Pocillopora meandrina]|uniref:Uncharacterized protein n=1 Tax=Pocillopora meandrina TaxID=46732 RepID=A0AAU9W3R0_9CNID|nr:unnamed protein product [Pocillopora meandrina]
MRTQSKNNRIVEVRENAGDHVAIVFSLASEWLRGWCKSSDQSQSKMHSVSILLMVLILSFAIQRSGADYAACANDCYSTYRQCVGICKVPADCFSCSNSWRNCDAGCRKKRELAANLGAGVYSKKDEKLSEFSLKKAASEKQKRMWNLLFYRRKRTA